MRTVAIRNVTIGEGKPKLCIPIVGRTAEEIVHDAEQIKELSADIVELRIDWFEQVNHTSEVIHTLARLRKIIENMPVLFTLRTANEGGARHISPEQYRELVITAAKSGMVDLIDVEVYLNDVLVKDLIQEIHKEQVNVIGSNHDFEKTPEEEEIIERLCRMQELHVDIAKIAVMPQSRRDVLTLLSATERMYTHYADRPIVTMSMGGLGAISRLSGEIFGSAITFGSAGKSSAPGQLAAQSLEQMLQTLHDGVSR